ncbi:MAG: hypothetical protein ACFFFK_06880 [Candidatus Thorarchaeota archaeon]
MSEQYSFKTLIQYLSAVALAIFFLIYLPWTFLSDAVLANVGLTWVYYFTLVLGLLFPMYYAIGKENTAWMCLGLALMLNSIIWMAIDAAQIGAAFLVLITGFLFFIAPFLENRLGNWDLVKNVFHFLKGLFLVLAVALYANFNMDAMIGDMSANHIMPQFIFMGGGIMIAFAFTLMCYGLFNIFAMFLGEKVGAFFGDLAKIFYMLMVLTFLLGILFNGTSYIHNIALGAPMNPWGATLPFTSGSINFFAGLFALGNSNLGAILLLILFIYGMEKIAKKFE